MRPEREETAADAAWLRFLPIWVRQRISGRHNLQAIVGNSGWLLVDRVGRLIAGLFVGVWVARYLGPEKFGQLNFAIAFVTLFSPIATLGLDGIVVRQLVRDPGSRESILGSALSLRILGSCIAVAAMLFVIWLLRPSDVSTRLLVGVIAAGLVFQSADVFDLWYQSRTQSKFAVYVKGVAFAACTLVKIVLIQVGAGLAAFAWIILVEAVIASIGLIWLYKRTEASAGSRLLLWSLPMMRSLLATSWPLFLSSAAILLYMRIDQVMLAELKGNVEVGLYSAALRLSEVWYVIATVVVASATPSLVRAQKESEGVYYARLQSLFTVLTKIAYAVILLVCFSAPLLVGWLYGPSYAAAAPVLIVHVWTALFVFQGVCFAAWAINQGMTKFYLGQTSIGLVVNIALNVVLIPRYGAVGAAVATLISQASVNYVVIAFMKSTRRIFCIETKALLLRT